MRLVIALLAGSLVLIQAPSARAGDVLFTPPIALQHEGQILSCAIVNAGSKERTVMIEIHDSVTGKVAETSATALAPGGGMSKAAVPASPDCSNGDCPCPPLLPSCGHYRGSAFCKFVIDGGERQFRAVGCTSAGCVAAD